MRSARAGWRAVIPATPFVLALAACSGNGREPAPAADTAGAAPPVAVRMAVASGGAAGHLEVPGTVEAVETAAIASRMTATVLEVRVEIGDAVRKGALLVRLDDRDLRARARAAATALDVAQAQLERLRSLAGREAATTREVEAAEAAAAAARAENDAAQAQMAYVDLRAPFDGRIADRRVQAGDLAAPGRPLLVLQGRGKLRAVTTVPREVADRLGAGDPVSVVRDDGTLLEARLAIIAPAGDAGSLRVLVKADLPGGAGLLAGSFVRLRFASGGEAPVLVPRAALVERGALTGVFVVADGHARLRWISPGLPARDAVEVRAGLAAGEPVIVDPGGLADGAAVIATELP
jgi:RND family efflux transporter MFP subunit